MGLRELCPLPCSFKFYPDFLILNGSSQFVLFILVNSKNNTFFAITKC